MTRAERLRTYYRAMIQEMPAPPPFPDSVAHSVDPRGIGQRPAQRTRQPRRRAILVGACAAAVVLVVLILVPNEGHDIDATEPAKSVLTTVASSNPTSTNPTPALSAAQVQGGVSPVDQDWSGLIVAHDDGISMLSLPMLEEVARVEGVSGVASNGSCSLALRGTEDGVLVGTDTQSGGSEALLVPWAGSDAEPGIVTYEFTQLGLQELVGPGGLIVRADDSSSETEAPVLTLSGSANKSMRYPGLIGRGFLLHGFDGRYLLVRAEPAEPACDRGTLFLVDLATGDVPWCIDQAAAILRPPAGDAYGTLDDAVLPTELDFSAC